VDVFFLVELQHGDRQAVILEGSVERREDAVGLYLVGGKV
jgi:hypothetical protein